MTKSPARTYWTSCAIALGGDRAKQAAAQGATIAFYRSADDGSPANGGSDTKAYPGAIHEIKGPLEICTRRALHATYRPYKWSGDKLWIVALWGKIQTQEDKYGALKREIICEVPNPYLGTRA